MVNVLGRGPIRTRIRVFITAQGTKKGGENIQTEFSMLSTPKSTLSKISMVFLGLVSKDSIKDKFVTLTETDKLNKISSTSFEKTILYRYVYM